MLNYSPNGGFFSLTAFELSPGMGGCIFCLGRTVIDFISDCFAVVVPQDGFFLLFGTKVTTVAMDDFFPTAEQLRHHRYIMDVSVYTSPVSLSTTMCAL